MLCLYLLYLTVHVHFHTFYKFFATSTHLLLSNLTETLHYSISIHVSHKFGLKRFASMPYCSVCLLFYHIEFIKVIFVSMQWRQRYVEFKFTHSGRIAFVVYKDQSTSPANEVTQVSKGFASMFKH